MNRETPVEGFYGGKNYRGIERNLLSGQVGEARGTGQAKGKKDRGYKTFLGKAEKKGTSNSKNADTILAKWATRLYRGGHPKPPRALKRCYEKGIQGGRTNTLLLKGRVE